MSLILKYDVFEDFAIVIRIMQYIRNFVLTLFYYQHSINHVKM